MFAPPLNIMHFKTVPLQIGDGHAKMVQFSTRKDVAGKCGVFLGVFREGLVIAFRGPCDGMVQVKTARAQQSVYRGKIGRIIGDADLFKHADGRDLIKLPLHFGVILELDFHAPFQPQAPNFRARQFGLFR